MSIILSRLCEVFKESKLTYYQLSEMTGLARSTLQRYITGATDKIPMDAIDRIARACHVSPAYIMGWCDDPNGGFSSYDPNPTRSSQDRSSRCPDEVAQYQIEYPVPTSRSADRHFLSQEKPTAEGDELDEELVSLLCSLTPSEEQRVRDFVAGLIAAREGGASHQG